MAEDLVICQECDSTGQADKVNRGFWVPGTCKSCKGSGWVNALTGKRWATPSNVQHKEQ